MYQEHLQTATSHHNFSDNALVNSAIKDCEWKDLLSKEDKYVEDILIFISETCHLDDYILDRIEL